MKISPAKLVVKMLKKLKGNITKANSYIFKIQGLNKTNCLM